MKFTCRLYKTDDIDKLVELWNENAEWGIIDRQHWEKVFYHTPLGPSTIVIAVDEDKDEVLAQFVFMPTIISVDGREVKACKPCAPIVKKSVREDAGLPTLFNYILKMYRFAAKHLITQGVFVLHMMPDIRWVRAFQIIPGLQVAGFPLWILPFGKKDIPGLPSEYTIEEVRPSDERISDLWQKASRLYDCCIVRNSNFLSWKVSHRNYKFVGLVKDSELAGFAVLLYKAEIKGIVICDVLAESPVALKNILHAACLKALEIKSSLSEAEQLNCEKVSVLATPLIEKAVADMGFEKYNYKFSLAVHVLGKGIPKKTVKPDRWYVSAND